jgi:hypothetical protein
MPNVAPHLGLLRQGIELIEALDDARFRAGVGAQLRHVVDFYACFLRGLAAGRVDYTSRERRSDLETDRGQAASAFAAARAAMAELSPEARTRPLEVRDEESDVWAPSSAGRELGFLHSHTVHHFALIRLMLSDARIPLATDFGVAPSTLRLWSERTSPEEAHGR